MSLKLSRILAFVAALLLEGCALGVSQQQVLPTLVPTLMIGTQDRVTVTPSQKPEESTLNVPATSTAPQATEVVGSPAPIFTSTETITPWPKNTSTPGPSPTQTRTPLPTRIPTRTIGPTRTPTITLTPTITFTPTPPPPLIDLLRPGLLSKVISPIQLEMNAYSGGDGMVTIELIGEDGRTISRQVLRRDKPNHRFWIAPEVPFEIPVAAEMSRLQVSTRDQFGRLEALSSVDLILLGVGRNEINPPAISQDPYLIRRPRDNDVISGGTLVINGLARPVNDSPLIIELVTESNRVISLKQLSVPAPGGALSHTPFTVEIPYKVSEPTPVLLILRQEGSRIPGTVALSSWKITLAP